MKKNEALAHWRGLKPNQPIIPHWVPIPYKASGSNYGACGIRIDGNPAFIDAVLSRLQDLLAGENHVTRLGLARSEVKSSVMGKVFPAGGRDAEVCYIRLHVRGGESGVTIFNRDIDAVTDTFFAERNGKTTRDALIDGQAARVAAFEDHCNA